MGFSKIFHKYREKMKTEMNQAIDIFWDEVNPEEEDQVPVGIKKLEDRFNEAFVDIEVAHCEDNQESAPSPPEQQQELRNRVCSKVQHGQEPGPEQKSEPEGSNNQSPGAQKHEESDCKPVQRLFQDMLKQLQKLFQDVLECLQDSTSLVKKIETIWSDIDKLCSSVAKYFSSL